MEILIVALLIVIAIYHFIHKNTKNEKEFYKRKCILAYKKIYTSMDTVRVENFLSKQYHETTNH